MGCLLAVIATICPRILMFFILLTTDWFGRAYDTFIWPFLGFLFMPYTTLAYMAAMLNNNHNVNGWWLVLVIIAALADLSTDTYEVQKRTK
jgi:cytochrome b561